MKKYVALVKGTTFTAADITYDPAGTPETVTFGDLVDPVDTVNALDTVQELKLVAKSAENTTNKAYIASDLNGDGVINALDVVDSLKLVSKVIVITNAAK